MTKSSAARRTKIAANKAPEAAAPAAVPAAAAPAAPAPSGIEVLNSLHHTIISVMARGLVASTPIQPEILLMSMSRAFGRVLGEMYGGEVNTVNTVRDRCRAAFAEEMLKVPVPVIPEEQLAQMRAQAEAQQQKQKKTA